MFMGRLCAFTNGKKKCYAIRLRSPSPHFTFFLDTLHSMHMILKKTFANIKNQLEFGTGSQAKSFSQYLVICAQLPWNSRRYGLQSEIFFDSMIWLNHSQLHMNSIMKFARPLWNTMYWNLDGVYSHKTFFHASPTKHQILEEFLRFAFSLPVIPLQLEWMQNVCFQIVRKRNATQCHCHLE